MGAIIRFAGMELDPAARQLRDDTGANVHVEQQVFDVLVHLAEHSDRVVPKTELLDVVWGHRFVTESTLTSRIKSARRAVGDSGDRQEVIRTVRGIGYQLAAEVDVVDQRPIDDAAESTGPGDDSEGAPTGTVTFLFTDVEGSTRLWERHTAAMEDALARHDEILRDTIVEHGGYVFSMAGDAYSAAFSRARDAVAAARLAQERLGAAEWPGGVEIRVRMGLHTGEALERDGDYFGPTLSRAARLMAAGWGGQVLLSDVAARLVSDVGTVDLGVYRLKDLGEPERLWQLGAGHFPPPRVSAAADVRLPEALTSFHGRAGETEELAALLATARLVTLVAPGGMGKTRLAVHAAARAADAFPGGVWFASLAEVGGDDAEAVPFALADAIGVRAEPDVPLVATLASWIGARRALLVFDNCEHVRGSAGAITARLLEACSGLTVLATSRVPLDLPAEQRLTVGALDVDAAVALFVDRVRRLDPSGAAAGPGVVELCEFLGGMPLAIELAASRCRSMTPGQLLERIGNNPEVLADRSATGKPQTLEGVLGWSVAQLDDIARELFARVSVFHGGFTLERLEEVAAAGLDVGEVLDAIDALVDAALVTVERGPDGIRYHQLEPVRQHGRRLVPVEVEAELVESHARAFARLATDIGAGVQGPEFAQWADTAERELANLRAAHRWAIDHRVAEVAVDIVAGLDEFVNERVVSELWEWNDATVALTSRRGEDLEARALAAAGASWFQQRRHDETLAAHDRVLAIPAAKASAARLACWAWWGLTNQGEFAQAKELWLGAAAEESHHWDRAFLCASTVVTAGADRARATALVAAVDSPTLRAWYTIFSTPIFGREERLLAAEASIDEAVATTERIGAHHPMGVALYCRGLILAQLTDRDEGETLRTMDRAIALWSRLRNPEQLIATLDALGLVLALLGHPEPAITLFAHVDARGGTMTVRSRSRVDAALAQVDADEATSHEARGRTLTPDDAVSFARQAIADLLP